jgi:Flp pilus assembly protein CpaB
MNLLSLILIFLALAVVGSIAYIAWELTSEKSMPRSDEKEPGESKESNDSPGPGEQT